MLNFQKLRESIKDVFEKDITPDQAEQLGRINACIDSMEEEAKQIDGETEKLRTKYVELVKNTTIDKPMPINEDNKTSQKSLLDFMKDEANKKK